MNPPLSRRLELPQIFAGRQGRKLRESLTGYAMISPAMLLIVVFGLFPVAFAVYVSLHKWLLIRSDFRGLGNYVGIIDNLAYVGVFALGVGALISVPIQLRRIRGRAEEDDFRPWPLAIPGTLHAAAVLAFVRWVYLLLPEILDVAPKMRGLERTRELFLGLLSDAFHAETVVPAYQQFVVLLVLSVAAGAVSYFALRSPLNLRYQLRFTLVWLATAVGVGLLYFDYSEVTRAYAEAVETGVDPGIWPQLIVIVSGVILLILAWRLWRSASEQSSNRHFFLRVIAAGVLMVGAVLLVIEIPTIVASGDQDLWDGLRVTVFFSLGTVPMQLAIGMFLAVILFQKIRGASAFRMIYFLPYITPALATATIFMLMFSDRQTGPVNRALRVIGVEPQRWLREPEGILTMLAARLGIEDYPSVVIPDWVSEDLASIAADWLAGPSQALTVMIMLSIWTFVGYNVVIYLAGLGNIPTELTEAAEIDGAGRWEVFRHVTFPLLSPTTYFLSLIAVIGTFKAFNTLWLFRQSVGSAVGTLNTISVVIFEEFFVKTRYGYASAMAFVLFAIILTLTLVNNRIQGSRVFYG